MLPSPFGLWIKETRARRNLSQHRLATLARMHRLQIVYLETGRTALPRRDGRQRIYKALGVMPPPNVVSASRIRKHGDCCSFCKTQLTEEPICFRTGLATICKLCIERANQSVAQDLRTRRTFAVEPQPRDFANKSVAAKNRHTNQRRGSKSAAFTQAQLF